VENVKSVHTSGGRDVLLGLGYMDLLGSNISIGFFSAGTLGNPWVEFHTFTLACG
jgi:hypothetical protein